MMAGAFGIIIEAEEQARHIRTQAAKAAKQAVDKANADTQGLLQAADIAAGEELKKLADKCNEKAEAARNELEYSLQNKLAVMEVKAERRMERAMALIVAKVMEY